MPKRSREDTEITINKIMDAVVEQLLTLGYDKMSYTTLSQATGVSRTGISHHFPKKTDFAMALDGRIFKMFMEYLDFNSGLVGFSQSWIKSLEDEKFQAILRLLFHHVVTTENAHQFARQGIDRLFIMLNDLYGEESKKELEWLFGCTMIRLASR
ncbi:transcriptional regulator luxT [Vibrio ishigakensis]|uniref:Transcriptional regulator luxT n=1 Tax=Vibrio ishigakensis TaxID=1481914 RepID=A0A0B8NVX3_9VIBR|nr:TetR family transcriptional regulator [Vibrio ishigakensis]GAM55263.1 transcriptional regulator luxT [Vibrio ishigakensis]GAM68094.1 transcriptional regulator luxT [Vibrio sp. JCM 19236]GAM73970.1 transcriptional regulator luxT [Vibrio ishigakensis]